MRYIALATDGDGTITDDGRMTDPLIRAMERFREAGGQLFLVTGESSVELAAFPRLDLFDHIVAENGAVLLNSKLGDERVLCEAHPAPVVEALRQFGASELKSGRIAVSTKEDERRVREALARQNLDWEVIRNRRDLLILPRGINKATGLAAALANFKLKPESVAAVGDAENDCAMIEFCGLGAAVANAVDLLKNCADVVLRGRCDRGVIELIEGLLRGEFPGK